MVVAEDGGDRAEVTRKRRRNEGIFVERDNAMKKRIGLVCG